MKFNITSINDFSIDLNDIGNTDRFNLNHKKRYEVKRDHDKNFKDFKEIYETEKIPYKNAKKKNLNSYKLNSSRLVK